MFDYSILRHGVAIGVGVNFKLKNPVEVLHFHKIQVQLNVSRIYTPKVRERGISRKHLNICNNPWIYKSGLFEEVGYEIP